MPGRTYATAVDGYRYAHNGQEKDNEIFDGALTAEHWEYDSRLGRRFETDPIVNESESPYACFNNNPIALSDPDGLWPGPGRRKKGGNHGSFQSKRRNHVHKNKGHVRRFFNNIGGAIKNGLSNFKRKLLHRLGHLDFNIGNHRIVSRRYRNITGFWNPFYHEKNSGNFNKNRDWGFSFGFRLGNFVFFDIEINRRARLENYFPGRNGFKDKHNSKFYFSIFYRVSEDDPTHIDQDYIKDQHVPLYTKLFKLPCVGAFVTFNPTDGIKDYKTLGLPGPVNESFLVDLVQGIRNMMLKIHKSSTVGAKRYKWF